MTKAGSWGNLTARFLFYLMNYNNLFEHELRKLIHEEITRITDILAQGISVSDYTEYKFLVGKITALNTVLDRCGEVQTILSQK